MFTKLYPYPLVEQNLEKRVFGPKNQSSMKFTLLYAYMVLPTQADSELSLFHEK